MNLTRSSLALIIFVTILPAVFAQSAPTTAAERQRERQVDSELEQRIAKMRELESAARPRISPPKITAEDREIAKENEKWINEKRKVDVDDLRQYSDLLENKNTGIFRLLPNFDCVAKNVVKIDGDCVNFVPATSDYSFQRRDYTGRAFHEIELNNGYLISNGILSHGVMVSLGDLPIDDVTLDHTGLNYLTNLKASKTIFEARELASKIKMGSTSNGYVYANRLPAIVNTTYALRVIDYRNTQYFFGAWNDRRDLIVVFRIVRSSADQGLTIIWKQLRRSKSPDLKFPKGEVPIDFRSR